MAKECFVKHPHNHRIVQAYIASENERCTTVYTEDGEFLDVEKNSIFQITTPHNLIEGYNALAQLSECANLSGEGLERYQTGREKYLRMIEQAQEGLRKPRRLFLGEIVVNKPHDVSSLLEEEGISLEQLLARHASGDWGKVSAEQNEKHLSEGKDVWSSYRLSKSGFSIYITTTAQPHTKTTVRPVPPPLIGGHEPEPFDFTDAQQKLAEHFAKSRQVNAGLEVAKTKSLTVKQSALTVGISYLLLWALQSVFNFRIGFLWLLLLLPLLASLTQLVPLLIQSFALDRQQDSSKPLNLK